MARSLPRLVRFAQFSETAPTWGRTVAPIAEWVAGTLSSRGRKPTHDAALPTRLTQRHKREAKGGSPLPSQISSPRRENVCRECGKTIRIESTNCADCARGGATERLVSAANLGPRGCTQPGISCQKCDLVSKARTSILRVGRIKPTSLAHERSVRSANPASTSERTNIRDSITNWCFALVPRTDPARLPPSSTALAGAGGTRGPHTPVTHKYTADIA